MIENTFGRYSPDIPFVAKLKAAKNKAVSKMQSGIHKIENNSHRLRNRAYILLAFAVVSSLLLANCTPGVSAMGGVVTPDTGAAIPTQSQVVDIPDYGVQESPEMLAYNNLESCFPYKGPITEQHLESGKIYAYTQVGPDGRVLSAHSIDSQKDIPVPLVGEKIEFYQCLFGDLDLGPAPDSPVRDAAEQIAASSLGGW
ncbi:hypothetical protein A2W14_01480 [Candidatus Gottesmanbacteria bacterium RBG_16_37_8]|uniref:Uncharacterized protein n=1 Tax=Candidatus Gottesmanbacteria bacterium RBG_16_37_8 TaxID=1798371 RepID=A0A1F5YQB3_9BACT|nr:MAG: hypothetical protein A2W14_01480 [Candidatus Gottesmanbacteria bacterium RBG_16_37_8]